MKKYFAILVLATLSSVACEKVQNFISDSDEDAITTIRVFTGDKTKTAVNGLNVTWSADDVVAVANEDDDVVEFTLNTGAGNASATFEGTLGGKALGEYAVYPFTGNASISGTSATVDFLSTWEYGKSIVPMYGVNIGAGEYQFQIIGGAILVSYSDIPATTNAKYFELTTNKGITGTASISNLDSTPSTDFSGLSGTTVTVTGIAANATSASVVIPVPAGTGYNFTVGLYEASTNELVPGTLKAATGRTITAKKIVKFPDVDLTPVISLTTPGPAYIVEAGANGSEISYAIANVAAGEKVSASANVAWISNIDYSTAGTVSFDVTGQTHGDAARTGVITLTYPGANDVTFNVSQEGKVYTLTGSGNSATGWNINDVNTNNSPWTFDGIKKYNGTKAIYSTSAIDANVTSVEVESGANNNLQGTPSLSVSAHSSDSDAASGTNAIQTESSTTFENHTVTLTKNNSDSWEGFYYRIAYTFHCSNGQAGHVTFTSAVFYGYIIP